MTLQALAKTIVDAVLVSLDHHTFAAIPDADIHAAYTVVAQLLRDESAALVDPIEEAF